MPGEGVVFYNLGVKCLPRLAVAMVSCRKHYRGPATLIHAGVEGMEDACQIARSADVDFKRVDFNIPPGKNVALLGKTLLHTVTPYDVSVFLDADTLTRWSFPEYFVAARDCEFAVPAFADWKTSGSVWRRIKQWRGIVPPDWIAAALHFGPAVNTGTFAFRKDSSLQREIYKLALQAREFFIPDEIGVQVLLPRFPHKIMPQEFNESCKYGRPYSARARIVHYHGRKHCRLAPLSESRECSTVHADLGRTRFLNASDLWLTAFEEVRDWPVVARHIQDDAQLRMALPIWDNSRKEKANAT